MSDMSMPGVRFINLCWDDEGPKRCVEKTFSDDMDYATKNRLRMRETARRKGAAKLAADKRVSKIGDCYVCTTCQQKFISYQNASRHQGIFHK